MARLGYLALASLGSLLSLAPSVHAQGDNLGLDNGYTTLKTQNFDLQLVRDAQVLASLKAAGGSFDFLPFDYLSFRAGNGQYHWGDVNFRYRPVGSTAWIEGNSAAARNPVSAVSAAGNNNTFGKVLASSNMAPTLPSNVTSLNVTREWLDVDGDLGLSFTLTNTGSGSIEVGSLGFPAEFNSVFSNRTASQTQHLCSLADPYIGLDAGYIRVAPVNGNGAALIVTPLGHTPFEAYRYLEEEYYENLYYGTQVLEGFYEWQTLTKAYAENEWKNAEPWNPPTSRTIAAGESVTFGLKFTLAGGGIRGIDDAVQATKTPYVRGVPGYIVPRDLTAQLIVSPGSGGSVAGLAVHPAGALTLTEASPGVYDVAPSPTAFGRARVTITYASGQLQTVHYYVTKPGPTAVSDLGHFLTTEQYYNDTSDPFGRAPSIITYDYETRSKVLQDSRVWIAGLSDESGAGAYLAAAMKQSVQPSAEEMAKLEAFVDGVLFKTIQPADGNFTVRRSAFYFNLTGYDYSPDYDWASWTAWTQDIAYGTDRAYNYVHVAAAYWALYRAGRAYPGTLASHPWGWYLNQSYRTVAAMMASDAEGPLVWYWDVGLMGETVFGELLKDLKREGLAAEAADMEAMMRKRAALWDTQEDPFGSEMAWDSTGQEGVYYWSKYFGYTATAEKTLGTVLGFQPTVAHWGWNGNARRYWDNVYGGKLETIERQIHHYGSGLNALVALSAFRSNPNDTYLLRIGYGGMNGPLSNINSEGFAAASFHSFPETLAWDGYSGDYGPNFLGLALGAASYLVEDEDLGLVAYGGTVTGGTGGAVTVAPRDAVRRRFFVGPIQLLLEVDAGVITEFTYTPGDQSVSVTLGQLEGAPATNATNVWLSKESGEAGYTVTGTGVSAARLGWQVPLSSGPVTIKVVPS